MKVSIAMNFSEDVLSKSFTITELSNKIDDFFSEKFYGSEVKELCIGVICVNASFDPFFKPRKVKFLDGYQTTIEGGISEINNCIEMEVKLNHQFVSENEGSILENYILSTIGKELPSIERLKLKTFDLNQLLNDWSSMKIASEL